MRATSGEHFIALDHVRALAIWLVVTWHFTHGGMGLPVPFQYVPALPPFALFDEGHTGVSLFMVLSGYLFAKLLDGKSVDYWQFLRNRCLRLLPLLVVMIVIVGVRLYLSGYDMAHYALVIALGAILATLPNGGWSITIEFHFYLILPVLQRLMRRSLLLPVLGIVLAIGLRAVIHAERGEVQSIAFWTIGGRFDQFVLGMLAWHLRAWFTRRHLLAFVVVAAFCLLYWEFDRQGGFYLIPPHSSPSRLWIILPTLEGIAYAIAIAWYDTSFVHPHAGVSRLLGRIGEYSYSIYLLHFFVVFEAARLVHLYVMDISNFFVACAWSVVFLLIMAAVGHLSFRFIEAPFLRRRKRYVAATA